LAAAKTAKQCPYDVSALAIVIMSINKATLLSSEHCTPEAMDELQQSTRCATNDKKNFFTRNKKSH
jgi:hypothetical protein